MLIKMGELFHQTPDLQFMCSQFILMLNKLVNYPLACPAVLDFCRGVVVGVLLEYEEGYRSRNNENNN